MSSVNPAVNIWETVLELLQNEMTPTTIKTWFDDVEAIALEEDEFVIYSPTPLETGHCRLPLCKIY